MRRGTAGSFIDNEDSEQMKVWKAKKCGTPGKK